MNLTQSSCRKLHALPHLRNVPEYGAACTALAAAQTLTVAPQTPDSLDAITRDIADTIRNGGTVDIDRLTTRAVDIARRSEALDALTIARNTAASHLLNELDRIAIANVPGVLKELDTELRDLATQLAAVSNWRQLENATTADEHRRLDEYRAFQDLRDRYQSIRSAQATCYAHGPKATNHHGPAALIRHQDALIPAGGWAEAQRGQTWRDNNGYLIAPHPVPWPTLDDRTDHTAFTDPAFLAWCLDNPDALERMWVPTPTQLKTETQRLDQVLEAAFPSKNYEPHARIVHH